MRVSVRALLLDQDDELIVFRRFMEERGVYYSAPGGKIHAGEDDETALRRELFEELGATAGELRYLFEAPGTDRFPTAHRFYATRLVSMDITLRTGAEFSNPAKGTYDVERIPCRSKALKDFPFVPPELATYLKDNADSLPALV
ncbi:MAG TPA: NUDIX hydrolase [Candidatus Limnocylindrales bacterium]|nr:NUDIX hydrolase [Candidatus Limnocylindrales bacterium]